MHVPAVPAVAAVALLGALTLAACGSDGGSMRSSTPSTRASRSARSVAVDDAANGKTVTLPRGAHLTVTLHSTYWQLGAPGDTRVLAVTTAPAARPDPSCRSIPGTGCGTVTAVYTAASPGTTTLAAHRDTCGEALRCTPAQSDWSVTVHATG